MVLVFISFYDLAYRQQYYRMKSKWAKCYEDAPPNSIKRSMLYVYGAEKIPVGVINSISNILGGIFDLEKSQVDMSPSVSAHSFGSRGNKSWVSG